MADEEELLVTIVDGIDPNEPALGRIKTIERPLTDEELDKLKPILENAGAYKFFQMNFSFADAPAVKQFLDSVQLDEFRRTTEKLKIVQDDMRAVVAGKEILINADLVWRCFGLVDDGLNISKPNRRATDLHTFYIKPMYVGRCQTKRGINLKHFKTEYAYVNNMARQIQAYCCGLPSEGYINMSQYRAIDLMIRKKVVNWNRYLLQNVQDRIRKYRQTTSDVFCGGTLTALIYSALGADYTIALSRVPVPQLPLGSRARKSEQDGTGTETGTAAAAAAKTGRKRKASGKTGGTSAAAAKRQRSMDKVTDAKRLLRRKKKKSKRLQPPRRVTMGKLELLTMFSHRGPDLPEEIASKLTKMYYEATGIKPRRSADVSYMGPLNLSTGELLGKFEHYYALEEQALVEHWQVKKSLEESLLKVKQLEAALKAKLEELESKAPLQRIQGLQEAVGSKDQRLLEVTTEIHRLRQLE